MRSFAARAPTIAGGRGRRHENAVRVGAQPRRPMTEIREVVTIRIGSDHLVRGYRFAGGSLGGGEILRPAAFTGTRAGMAIVAVMKKVLGRSSCGAEARKRERRTDDFAHENAPQCPYESRRQTNAAGFRAAPPERSRNGRAHRNLFPTAGQVKFLRGAIPLEHVALLTHRRQLSRRLSMLLARRRRKRHCRRRGPKRRSPAREGRACGARNLR